MGRIANNFQISDKLKNKVASVYSTTGFQAGDYVYYSNGDYGVPNVTSAKFEVISDAISNTTLTNISTLEQVENNAIASLNNSTALLSNGNIVVAFISNGNYAPVGVCFKITDINNNVVVATTQASTNYSTAGWGDINVVALSGGGFVLSYINSAGSGLCYKIYDNSGNVTVNETVLSGLYSGTDYYQRHASCALTNGGFALLYPTSTTGINGATYSSTGTQLASLGIASTISTNTDRFIQLVAREVSGVHQLLLSFVGGAATTQRLYVYNAVTGSPIISTSWTIASYRMLIAGLNKSTNEFVLLGGTSADASILIYRTVSTADVLSSETILASSFNSQRANIRPTFISLSSGNFAVVYPANPATTLYIEFFSSNYAYLGNALIRGVIYQAGYPICFIENSGHLYGYVPSLVNNPPNGYSTSFLGTLYRFKVNIASMKQVAVKSSNMTSISTGITTSNYATTGYDRSTSTINTGVFYSELTQTPTTSFSATTGSDFWVAPKVVDSITPSCMQAITLPNGNILAIYQNNSTGALKYVLYTGLLSVVSSGTITSSIVNAPKSFSATALPNGKIAILYFKTTNQLAYFIYSSSMTLLSSGNFTPVGNVYGLTTTHYYQIYALTTNRLLITGHNASPGQATWEVRDDTLTTTITAGTLGGNIQHKCIHAAPTLDGGFAISWNNTGTVTWNLSAFKPSSNTTYNSVESQVTTMTSGFENLSSSIVCTASGLITAIAQTSATQQNINQYYSGIPTTFTTQTIATPTLTTQNGNATVTIDGVGNPVLITSYTNQELNYGTGNAGPTFTSPISFNAYQQGYGALISATPSYGRSCAVMFIDSVNYYINICLIRTFNDSYSTQLVANTTKSIPTTIDTNTYIFSGVSLTACSAGSTAWIQTNGSAKLSDSYPETVATTSFDYDTSPAIKGLKGFLTNRILTLIGN